MNTQNIPIYLTLIILIGCGQEAGESATNNQLQDDKLASLPFTLYPNSKLREIDTVTSGNESYTLIAITSSKPAATIHDYYENTLAKSRTEYAWVPDHHIDDQFHSAYKLDNGEYLVLEYRKEREEKTTVVVHFLMPPSVYNATFQHYAPE